ncbi:AEC family transporter [Nocardioides sp.]|uniref:AEC family transporter n=1 Tax=Nocardioides sp. TaxID=35761 RepID=UPI003D0B4210
MAGVFSGYASITMLIVLGVFLAQLRIVDEDGQRTLSTLALSVASPALLITVLQDASPGSVMSGDLIVTSAAVFMTAALAGVVAVARGMRSSDVVMWAMCSAYGNAGNLGLPIAAYVLGDAALAAPTLLLQMLILQPLIMMAMDVDRDEAGLSVRRVIIASASNPITVASALGLALAVTGSTVPLTIGDPLTLLAGMAVPSMLIAYGVSLRLGPLPGRGVPLGELGVVVALKLIVQPLLAYTLGRFVVDLSPSHLLAVTVLAALPAAHSVFVVANRYHRSSMLARDAIFVSTLTSVPTIIVIIAILG